MCVCVCMCVCACVCACVHVSVCVCVGGRWGGPERGGKQYFRDQIIRGVKIMTVVPVVTTGHMGVTPPCVVSRSQLQTRVSYIGC